MNTTTKAARLVAHVSIELAEPLLITPNYYDKPMLMRSVSAEVPLVGALGRWFSARAVGSWPKKDGSAGRDTAKPIYLTALPPEIAKRILDAANSAPRHKAEMPS